ncbi:hypothetical protein, partial [Butyricicoccus sp.]|uniref:hypothetical protein n=1 Tax=Butyricicoccus sp. TaxID=2049021 RepID=UPI003AB011CA
KISISELCRWDCRQSFLVEGERRGGGKSPMLWQVFSVQMANSRRFMQALPNQYALLCGAFPISF